LFRQHLTALLLGTFALSACASTVSTVNLSPRDPADPAAPEAATPAFTPELMSSAPSPPRAAPEKNLPHEHHLGESPAFDYACPMHHTVKQSLPGKCPICGMTLVRQEAK